MKSKLPQFKDCTGCMTCLDVCKHDALSLKINHNGFYEVLFNDNNCIGCGACEKACPSLVKPLTFDFAPKSYYGWSLNQRHLFNSASGGLFIEIACSFFCEHEKAAAVVGCEITDEQVRHSIAYSVDELIKFQNSKYLQSDMRGIYAKSRNLLKEGYAVLFSGTPCQIAGLLNVVPHVLRDKLFTIEIICHGVPSFDVLQSAKNYYSATELVSFRTKTDGWYKSQKCTYLLNNGKEFTPKNDMFYNMFLSEYFIRKSCYTCKYASLPRYADLTIGDFWGRDIKKNESGTSLFFINHERIEHLVKRSNIEYKEIDLRLALENSSRLTCNLYFDLKEFPKFISPIWYCRGERWCFPIKMFFRFLWHKLIIKRQEKKKELVKNSIEEYERGRNHNHT